MFYVNGYSENATEEVLAMTFCSGEFDRNGEEPLKNL